MAASAFRKGLVLFLLLLVPLAVSTKEAERKVSVSWTHWYEIYNEEYFDDRLPEDLVVYSGPADGNMAETDEETYIEINPYFNNSPRTARWTLLHECCHVDVKGFEDHGPKWERCMRRLANEGAFDDIW